MICKDCAKEADGVLGVDLPESVECQHCGKTVRVTRVGGALRAHRMWPGPSSGCPGSGAKVPVGHAACKGCDCHHKPRGWRS